MFYTGHYTMVRFEWNFTFVDRFSKKSSKIKFN